MVPHVLMMAVVGSVAAASDHIRLSMPNAMPARPETYLCTAFRLDRTKPTYVVGFEPDADAKVAHHIIVYGCKVPGVAAKEQPEVFSCGEMETRRSNNAVSSPSRRSRNPCRSGTSIIYAWASNAPLLHLPEDVAFQIGGPDSGIRWLVLQVHYATVRHVPPEGDTSAVVLVTTDNPRPKRAGVYVMAVNQGIVLPRSLTKMEVACEVETDLVMHPFAFRVHTHALGDVVSGWKVEDRRRWTLVGKADPQLPQMFFPVDEEATLMLRRGDVLAARCTMNNSKSNATVEIGLTREDEMCNFYVMYWVDGTTLPEVNLCLSRGPPEYTWAAAYDPYQGLFGGGLNNIPDEEASRL